MLYKIASLASFLALATGAKAQTYVRDSVQFTPPDTIAVWIVPPGNDSVDVVAQGAAGGRYVSKASGVQMGTAGRGWGEAVRLAVHTGDTIFCYVGGMGGTQGKGGFNGGGQGAENSNGWGGGGSWGGGGGGTAYFKPDYTRSLYSFQAPANTAGFVRIVYRRLATGVTPTAAALDKAVVLPNPSGSAAQLHLELSKTATLRIQVVDGSGRIVWERLPEQLPAAAVNLALPAKELPAGLYLIQITGGSEEAQTLKWIKE